MINIYCYNWNFKLSPQGIIDSNCGYHAIKNGNAMLNLLNNSTIDYNNYLNSIKKSNIYSNANHGFTLFKSKRYESTADKKSWNSFKSFLKSSMENK